MASLQCSKCGDGIHYHSLPQDIEYIFFSKGVWNLICSTQFDKKNKVMDESGIYPKLFRSSTIESDYAGKYVKIWKCPTCGTLHVFSDDGSVKKVFVRDDAMPIADYSEEGILFSDFLWKDLTENDMPNKLLKTAKPSFYVKKCGEHLLLSDAPDFSNPYYYKLYNPV